MSETSPLQSGQKVGTGRFTLVRALGRGGMGEVWLARDERLEEPAALKFLPPEVRADPVALHDLRRETARSHKLTHPNIVRIYDLHEEPGGQAFIAMEYVDGPTLSALRLEQPNYLLTWEYLRPLVQQLCAALDYAHGEKVIHRDLKPANVMVHGKGRLKLADFGIAATVSDSVSRVSGRHATSGTLPYMSPQQLAGKHPQVADDIYALGATLYELLTSKPPFYTGDLTHQVLHEPPEPLEERLAALGLANTVPPDVAALIMACLAKDPAQRPLSARAVAEWIGLEVVRKSSVESLAEAMFPHSDSGPVDVAVDVRRPGAPELAVGARNLAPVASGVVVALLVAGAGIWYSASHRDAGKGIQPAAQSTGSTAEVQQPNGADGNSALVKTNIQSQPNWLTAQPVPPLVAGASSPAAATKDKPWVNSLGMKFVPVPGTKVIFCIWETRAADYQAFVSATRRGWGKPSFPQNSNHPAVMVSWEDAKAFCQWLTERERGLGLIKVEHNYRLPTDSEWSLAAGLTKELGTTPCDKNGKVQQVYPWGSVWPPPARVGNYADRAAGAKYPKWQVIDGYDDGYAETSPVASFPANQLGLFDVGGNVWTWCEDKYQPATEDRVLRGASFINHSSNELLTSSREFNAPSFRSDNCGCRCVLDGGR